VAGAQVRAEADRSRCCAYCRMLCLGSCAQAPAEASHGGDGGDRTLALKFVGERCTATFNLLSLLPALAAAAEDVAVCGCPVASIFQKSSS
jgi:hypothetical protein